MGATLKTLPNEHMDRNEHMTFEKGLLLNDHRRKSAVSSFRNEHTPYKEKLRTEGSRE